MASPIELLKGMKPGDKIQLPAATQAEAQNFRSLVSYTRRVFFKSLGYIPTVSWNREDGIVEVCILNSTMA